MTKPGNETLVELEPEAGLWERAFTVAPLVLIGTLEEDGSADLAPKHLAMPLSFDAWFGFVCTPSHGTYANVRRTGEFTVTYPGPDQVVLSSLAASPRCADGAKPMIAGLPTFSGSTVDAPFLKGGRLFLECRLDRILDGFGSNSLIVGTIVSARAPENALLSLERDPDQVLHESPLLAYIHPGRYAVVADNASFPLPRGFRK